MLFSSGPKEQRKDLYNFDNELERLIRAYHNDLVRLIVIKGLRRTGKSSLLRVSLNESGLNYILIDMREFDIISRSELYEYLRKALLSIVGGKMKYLADKVRALSVVGIKLELEKGEQDDYRYLMRKVNDWAKQHNTYFILAIDEAQELAKIGFSRYLAFVYDNLSRIKIVLAGSQVGVLNKLFEDPEAPLFGRAREEISLSRFNKEQSIDFLKKGFAEVGLNVSDKYINNAVSYLDGIVGWLVMYGFIAYQTGDPELALEQAVNDGMKLVKNELNKFLETRGIGKQRYLTILKILGEKKRRWKEIKKLLEFEEGKRLGNNQVSHYLNELVKYGIVMKKDAFYYLPDPILQQAVLKEF
ncbi:MAG: AAA family ATPase [Candidatus Asgardarchaeia archaeon]